MLDAIRYMFNEALKNVDVNKNTARADGEVKHSKQASFAEQVIAVINGSFSKETSHVYMSDTPSVGYCFLIKKEAKSL